MSAITPEKITEVPGHLNQDRVAIEASQGFVETPQVGELTERALTYLGAGYPVHLCGPAGTGKTTLAFHIAARLNNPVTLINGDDEFGTSDLVGRNSGFRRERVVDNYIRNVLKTEDEYSQSWQDNRLTTACRHGYTLIYDEFTRTRPEANNALLSVFEEGLLNLPKLARRADSYLEVHPNFRAIFTSNPEEYAGVHRTQDALMDRMITIHLDHPNRDTEVAITVARSGLDGRTAELIVDTVRELREKSKDQQRPTIRASIAIAKILVWRSLEVDPNNPFFLQVCRDVLNMENAGRRGGSGLLPDGVVEKTLRSVRAKAAGEKAGARKRAGKGK